jgi:hypothetical protein
MTRNPKGSVMFINALMACVVIIASCHSYVAEAALAHLLGNTKIGLMSYVASHMQEFASRGFVIAILGCGIFLEARRSKAAVFVNIGLPLCLLVLILTESAISWREGPQYEVEQALILVASPLLALILLEAFLYRRELRVLLNRTQPL